ncbi:Pin family phage protein [Trabulsiella guamensis ATCC 49490]|uniref:Pin family phage protein n=1 Tax=Trabulsiella guamensis ATCC 49490 TaxID=1005994 RepID=A0A085ADP1_9ENTR|nr:hypothetical protein [Trabulsiella guamensis]KFC08336.1 Pin family phage protein [Trabulsiella guamensis ATCC 49490]
MATNDFKPFATGAGANVTSQADWESLPALPTGFTSGKASSAQVNKALRQPSTIAAMVGQFIANANLDALDNGDLDTLVENFTNSLIANLGLGTAANRDVGTEANQIPDMSSFLTNIKASPTGLYHYLPSGLLIQFGNIAASSGDVTTTFPVAFPNACLKVMATQAYSAGSGNIGYIAAAQISKTQMISRGSSSQLGGVYLAVGF